MVVLEAMSHKLPIIVSSAKYCGFSEHITHNEALILNNPKNANQIKEHITQLHYNLKLRKSLSLSGLNKSKEISWKKTLDQTLFSYKQVVK
jgi:UDP-glucose:(heptosyl)LPS alpha-1,3-glucosyltransferase